MDGVNQDYCRPIRQKDGLTRAPVCVAGNAKSPRSANFICLNDSRITVHANIQTLCVYPIFITPIIKRRNIG
jgi:hypothetical protein